MAIDIVMRSQGSPPHRPLPEREGQSGFADRKQQIATSTCMNDGRMGLTVAGDGKNWGGTCRRKVLRGIKALGVPEVRGRGMTWNASGHGASER